MAAISSNGTGGGDWDAGATWVGGVVPGASAADSVTIVAGDTVSLNITTHTSTVTTVTIDATGKLTIDAQFNTDAKFTGDWSVSGEVEFNKASGTYELRIQGEFSIKSGGTLDMDGTAAGCKQILSSDATADESAFFDAESGSIIIITGRAKTGRSQLDGAHTTANTTITVTDDTGWEENDVIALIRDHNNHETVTLGTVVTGKEWNIDEANLTKTHNDLGEAWNLTRSCVVQSSDASFSPICDFLAGATLTVQQAEFYHLDQVTINGQTLTDCSTWGVESGEKGFRAEDSDIPCTFVRCIAHCISSGGSGFETLYTAELDTCCAGPQFEVGVLLTTPDGARSHIHDCIFISGFYSIRINNGVFWDTLIENCYVFGGGDGVISRDNSGSGTVTACVFGREPGGTVNENDQSDCNVLDSSELIFDDCEYNSSVSHIVAEGGRIVSLNHNNLPGYRLETQEFGVSESDSTDARSASYCDSITPSSADYPFRYMTRFFCDTGKTPTLKLYAKEDGSFNGDITVSLGRHRCGLTDVASSTGSLDANDQFTVSSSYGLITITLEGTSTGRGEVELFIDVTGTAGVVYFDDFEASNNT